MSIGIYDIRTAKEIREALGLACHILQVGYQEIIEKKSFYKEGALERSLQKAHDKGMRDTLEYTYRFLTNLAYLSTSFDRFDGERLQKQLDEHDAKKVSPSQEKKFKKKLEKEWKKNTEEINAKKTK